MKNDSGCALFDWDGTVNPGFTLLPWTSFLRDRELLTAQSFHKITGLFHAYNNSEINHEMLCHSTADAYAQGLRGRDSKEIEVVAGLFVQMGDPKLYSYATELFALLKYQKISIVVVSGTPSILLREYAKVYPIDQVFGLELRANARDALTGEILNNPGLMKDKNAVVGSLPKGIEVLYAFGNSISDTPLFEIAEVAVLVNGFKNCFPRSLTSKLNALKLEDVVGFVKKSLTRTA